MKLLIATHNPGKIREYRALLNDLPIELTWLDAEGVTVDVPETGATFVENATIKARAYAQMTGLWTWADDSGLVVDALDGRPGVFSARYGGPGDRDRCLKVLGELQDVPRDQWQAQFRCAVALADPDGAVEIVEERLDGVITDDPRGEHGFGYDPIFFLPDHGRTLAELPPDEKNRVSHRARAAALARARIAARLASVQRIVTPPENR